MKLEIGEIYKFTDAEFTIIFKVLDKSIDGYTTEMLFPDKKGPINMRQGFVDTNNVTLITELDKALL